jgi:uncharacterized protein
MAITGLILGAIPLGVNTVTYNNIKKQYNTSWAKQDRINNTPILQNTGNQSESMSISGLTIPSSNATELAALVTLKELSSSATPNFMFDTDGAIYGKWVIDSFSQDESNGDQTTYSMNLQRYPDSSLLEESKAYVKGIG